MQAVTRNTRAPSDGRRIVCPHCGGIARVFHFSWSGLGCTHCGQMVEKHKWGLAPNSQPLTTPHREPHLPMDHAISIRLTQHQYNILKEMARQQHRTIGNCYTMLAAYGMPFYFTDNEAPYITRQPDDSVTASGGCQNYSSAELEAEFAKIPLQQ